MPGTRATQSRERISGARRDSRRDVAAHASQVDTLVHISHAVSSSSGRDEHLSILR
jgi:hypothetical protein